MALCRGSYLLSLLLLTKLSCVVAAEFPESLLCVDAHCTRKIGEGITLQRFNALDESKISFLSNEKVTIYAKSNDKDHDICFVEINGRKGFAPKRFIREERSFHKTANLVTAKVDDLFRSENDNVSKYKELSTVFQSSSIAPSGTVQGTTADVLQQHSIDTVQTSATPSLPKESSIAPAQVADKSLLVTATPQVESSLSNDAIQSAARKTPVSSLSTEQSCTLDGTPMFGEHCNTEASDTSYRPPQSFTSGLPITTTPRPYGMNVGQRIGNAGNKRSVADSKVLTEEPLSDVDMSHINTTESVVPDTNHTEESKIEMGIEHSNIKVNGKISDVDSASNLLVHDTSKMAVGTNERGPAATTEQKEGSPASEKMEEEASLVKNVEGKGLPINHTAGDTPELKPMGQTASIDDNVLKGKEIENIPGEEEEDDDGDTEVEVEDEADVEETRRNKGKEECKAADPKLDSSLPSQVLEHVHKATTDVAASAQATVVQTTTQQATLRGSAGDSANVTFNRASPTPEELSQPANEELGAKVSGISDDKAHLTASFLVTAAGSLKAVSHQTEGSSLEPTSSKTSQHVVGTSSSHEFSESNEGELSSVLLPSATETSSSESHSRTPLLNPVIDTSRHTESTLSPSAAVGSVSTSSGEIENVAESPLVADIYNLSKTGRTTFDELSKSKCPEESKDNPEIKVTYERRSLFSLSPSQDVTLGTSVQSPTAAPSSESNDATISGIHAWPTQTEKLGAQQTENLAAVPSASSERAEGLPVTGISSEKESSQETKTYSETKDVLATPEVPPALESPPVAEVSAAVNSPPVTEHAPEPETPPETEDSAHESLKVTPLPDGDTEQLKLDDDPSDDSVSYVQLYVSLLKEYTQLVVDGLPEPLHAALYDQQVRGLSPRVTVFTFLCGFFSVVLVISFGCFLNNKTSTSLMVSIASLEKNLFNTRTERDVLKEEVEQFKLQVSNTHKVSLEKHDQVKRLLKENKDLERSNQQLEAALQKVRDAWNQDRNKLGTLSSELNQKENQIAELQCASEKEKDEIQTKSSKLLEYEGILEEERAKLKQLRDSEQQLQRELEDMQMTQEKLIQERDILNERVGVLSSKVETDAEEIRKLLRSLHDRDAENQVLQESIKNLAVLQDMCNRTEAESQDAETSKEVESCLNRLMDVGQMRLEYQEIKEQNDVLEEQLAAERRHLERKKDQVEALQNDMEKLKRDTREAQRERTDAVTKLEILSSYFKDREVQLQKEIGKQEVLRNQKDADATTAEQQLSLLEQQNASYKSQLSSLKQEMEISERNYKNQITDQEKRAHENWLAARAAERKLEEANKELASIRQRLTLLQREKEQAQEVFTNSHSTKPLPSDDLPAGAPPLPPLPPPMFLPPPPFMGEPFPPHPPEPWMLHGGLPPPPPPEVFKRHHRGSPGSFARASPGSSLRDDSPPPHSRGSPPMRLPHFYDTRGGHSPPPLGPSHGLPPMTLGFRGPRGLHRSSNSLSDGKSSAHSTSRPSPQPSTSVRKNNGPATGV